MNWKKYIPRYLVCAALAAALVLCMGVPAFAAGNVSTAIEATWTQAKAQIETVVNNVVFPCCDMILAILFFVKVGMSYLDYRKQGQFDFTAPAILFICLVFTLTAPLYIWTII